MKIMRPSLLVLEVYRLMATEAEILKILAEERNMRKAAERLFYPNPPFLNDCKRLRKTGVHSYLFAHRKV